jgi:hypothetical protein
MIFDELKMNSDLTTKCKLSDLNKIDILETIKMMDHQ